MKKPIRYERAPSPELCAMLSPGGMLRPLLTRRTIVGLPLDVHLREKDHVHVYCGLTRLLDASLVRGGLRLHAADTYRNMPGGADLFRTWSLGSPGFESALDRYLAQVNPLRAFPNSEGGVHAAWSQVQTEWMLLDREAVVGYEDKSGQSNARYSSEVSQARKEIETLATSSNWARLSPFGSAAELDQLAIDHDGRLVLLELKYGKASESSVYYAPFQLLQYAHEWHRAFSSVREALGTLRQRRIELGLSLPHIAELKGGLRPVIGFGEDICSQEVSARLSQVCALVNRYLPSGMSPIEIWALKAGKPTRLIL